MSGQSKRPYSKSRLSAILPISTVAAAVAAVLTVVIWQSPRFLDADVQPSIIEFDRFGASRQTSQPASGQPDPSLTASQAGHEEGEAAAAAGQSIRPRVHYFGKRSQPREPSRTDRSNGSLVMEWPAAAPLIPELENSLETPGQLDPKQQAIEHLRRARHYLNAGSLVRALRSARLAYSYPVNWRPEEDNPEEFLTELNAMLEDDDVVAAARLANHVDVDNDEDFGTWKPLPAPSSLDSERGSVAEHSADVHGETSEPASSETEHESAIRQVSGETTKPTQGLAHSDFSSADKRVKAFSTQHFDSSTVEPEHLRPSLEQAESDVLGQFANLERRLQLMTNQQTVASPGTLSQTLTFDVLATLITIFAVLFFGTLLLLLTVLAVGKKVIGGKGVAFRIELVNSPLTVQAGAANTAPASESTPASVADELKLDADFEGILSMSEQRARQREAAILKQFVENNVSLHQEINANQRAA